MKKWMQKNWAKLIVRTIFIAVIGILLVPHMKSVIEAQESEKSIVDTTIVTDSLIGKYEVVGFIPNVQSSDTGKVLLGVKELTVVTPNGDTLSRNDFTFSTWVLDGPEAPLKVCHYRQHLVNGSVRDIAELHIPSDIYENIMK